MDTFLDITENVDFDATADTVNRVFDAVSALILFLVANKEVVLGALAAVGAGLVALKLAN